MPETESVVTLELENPANAPVRFHLSLNVANLTRSVDFFRLFFGQEPSKRRDDYAKFELDEPPVVLSLEPAKVQPGGNLNHLGFRMPTTEKLIEFQRRLEMGGVTTQREEGVECCYAKQTKFWAHDPDGNLWEIYTFDGDIEHRGVGQVPDKVLPPKPTPDEADATASAPSIWAHRIGERLPKRLPIDDATVDQVNLQGTFNAEMTEEQQFGVLAEVHRITKPGGEINLHVLTASKPVGDTPLQLPGPAAVVRQVPVDSQLAHAIESAGFTNLLFTKLGDSPCFTVNGIEMRETKLVAYKPLVATSPQTKTVLYKGPFRQLEDDAGHVFYRGQRVTVDDATWERLKTSPLRESFLCEAANDRQAN